MRYLPIALVGAISSCLALGEPAAADIITQHVDASFFSTPYTINLGTDALIFSTIDPSPYSPSPAAVQTVGSAQVFSSFGAPADFFSNRGGSFPTGQLGQFASYATPTAIPYSGSEGLVGFEYLDGGALHYGYADIAGTTLIGYRYNTTAGADLPFAPVPEPATWALLIFGALGIGGLARRRRAVLSA